MAGPDVLVWLATLSAGDRLRELAVVLTDGQLAELAPPLEVAIGALEELPAAELKLLALVDAHVPQKVQPVLAGSAIQRDRRLVRRDLPAFDRRVHYRMVDVWTIGELARRWYPGVVAERPPAPAPARALDAARESIAELRFYRERVFTAPAATNSGSS